MDTVHNYFQLAHSEESSFLTTFLLQQGKFRYLRAPVGLNVSSDEWCYNSDRMVMGLPWAKKIVDDTIIWAPTLDNFFEEIRAQKGHFPRGTHVSQSGITPDDGKYKAIAEFPSPENVSLLRSFLGLANQLTAFVPDLAHMTATLQPLLKKGTAWIWIHAMKEEFQQVKLFLTNTTTVQPFNPSLDSIPLDRCIKTLWHRIRFAAAFTKRQMVFDPIWLRIHHSNKIRHHRFGMHGHPVGYLKMLLLPPRTFVSGWCQDGNTSSRAITEVKHLELNQSSEG